MSYGRFTINAVLRFHTFWRGFSCHKFDVSRAYYVSLGNVNFTLVIRGSALSGDSF